MQRINSSLRGERSTNDKKLRKFLSDIEHWY